MTFRLASDSLWRLDPSGFPRSPVTIHPLSLRPLIIEAEVLRDQGRDHEGPARGRVDERSDLVVWVVRCHVRSVEPPRQRHDSRVGITVQRVPDALGQKVLEIARKATRCTGVGVLYVVRESS